ncbi:MAG TPA: penicillin-binding protein 2 [Chloroflexota bacterium]|nr:penicillin-binding protein 2 [Chloroflexota bacterium]
MNANIRRLGIFFLIAFGVIVADLTYWQVLDASNMVGRPDNPRLRLQADQVRRGRIYDRNGVLLAGRTIDSQGFVHRYYTDPSLSTVIGYDSPRYGMSELEQSYNDYLTGQVAGASWTQVVNSWEHRPVTGDDITLTIDDRLQRDIDALMPPNPSAAVVMDPRNGQVLAMVSHPNFDANQIKNPAYWQSLLTDPGRPLINRVADGYYPPGSTFKIVTLSAALDSGVSSLNDIYAGTQALGPITVDGHVFPNTINNLNDCGGRVIPPPITLEEGLVCSDNIVFIQVGLKLGGTRFLEYAHRFGIGSAPPFPIPVLASHVHTPGTPFGQLELAQSAFGQGDLHVTPLAMVMATAAIGNGGVMETPQLIKTITAPNGSAVTSPSPSTYSTPISPTTASEVTSAMKQVVAVGTGVLARSQGISIAGKTGTAETGGTQLPHAWFVCFAPADHPRIAVAVIVEHGGEGATTAAPLAGQIVRDAVALGY